jgi:WD40 repeat protein
MTVIKPGSSRVAGLVSRLQNMAPTQDIAAHVALVRHMQVNTNQVVSFTPFVNHVLQFSPDGKFLATASWDRTSVIFHVGVCLIDVSLRCITERLVRNNLLPTVCCCTPLDSLVKLHGKSGSSGK